MLLRLTLSRWTSPPLIAPPDCTLIASSHKRWAFCEQPSLRTLSTSEIALVHAVLRQSAPSPPGAGTSAGAPSPRKGAAPSARRYVSGAVGGGAGSAQRDEQQLAELLMRLSWTAPPELSHKPGGDTPIASRLREAVTQLCHQTMGAMQLPAAGSTPDTARPTLSQLLPLARALPIDDSLLEVAERFAQLVARPAGDGSLDE